jgi:hypothetical protein|tara:strand:- start:846 stop:1034 length:189 start_codon:yes stop_codon:yes gene_type:complete
MEIIMKKVNWKSNRIFKMSFSIVVSGLEDANFLLKRKKRVEIPTMKAKNIVQWKKSDNKKKK